MLNDQCGPVQCMALLLCHRQDGKGKGPETGRERSGSTFPFVRVFSVY